MPYVLKDKQIPKEMMRRQDKVSRGVQVLILIVPLLEAASGTAQTLLSFKRNERVKALKVVLDVNTYLVGILEVISGACLMFAVHQINRYLKKNTESNINKRALLLHAIAFGLYLASVIVLDSFYAYY